MLLQQPTPPKRIFLVDDDSDDRSLFVDALSAIDQSVILTQAENGEQLMNLLQTPPEPLPEIVIMDLNMPKLSGFECLEAIRNDAGKLKDLNVVIFTTSNSRKNVETAFALGASFYAVKPNSFEELKVLVRSILNMNWSHPTLTLDRNFVLAS